ncbi:hypothetical protein B0T17DRAFT_388680 [Bombardia bombarda]|uniref:Uncharacterized protein n=1 Tax=Bombardia bombarda TaxID=252184 RepID=A0AA39TZV6_9PEZI|nr:hypothetical protein B0T17DRAFT_388680 [Bombardia bombarda]
MVSSKSKTPLSGIVAFAEAHVFPSFVSFPTLVRAYPILALPLSIPAPQVLFTHTTTVVFDGVILFVPIFLSRFGLQHLVQYLYSEVVYVHMYFRIRTHLGT